LIAAWRGLYLYHFFEIVIGPSPGAFSEQFFVDVDAIGWLKAFPFTADVYHSSDICCVHTVFSGGILQQQDVL
jgi:hypothetical protein